MDSIKNNQNADYQVMMKIGQKIADTVGEEWTINVLEAKPLSNDCTVSAKPHIPSISASAVLGESMEMPKGTPECRGHDFSKKNNDKNSSVLDGIMSSFLTTGFQATNLALAAQEIEKMRSWRLSDRPYREGIDDESLQSNEIRKRIRARIFLAYTSNQISCGQREVIRYLVQNKMIDVIVTTAGGIEEDIIKCLHPTYMGDFKLSGKELRKNGINRIGNLLVPNRNYCDFEDWFTPIVNKMHDEQDESMRKAFSKTRNTKEDDERNHTTRPPFVWTPSKFIHRLGIEINNPDSVLYWAAVNNIPIFCPALTDGSIGDMLYFHSYKRRGLLLDINEDIRRINDLAVQSHCTGQIILGGGVAKHHTCNANLMRNGADYSVYINTASDHDGSDTGASPDEAISWGKIRASAQPVKVTADATIAFPLLVATTFAKDVENWKESTKDCVCWVEDT